MKLVSKSPLSCLSTASIVRTPFRQLIPAPSGARALLGMAAGVGCLSVHHCLDGSWARKGLAGYPDNASAPFRSALTTASGSCRPARTVTPTTFPNLQDKLPGPIPPHGPALPTMSDRRRNPAFHLSFQGRWPPGGGSQRRKAELQPRRFLKP